jgi:hypothetical protein
VVYNKNLKKIFKISTNQNTLWALAAMLDFRSVPKTKICKFKMAAMTRLSLTLDPMGISHFHLFFWNHKTDLNQTWQKCSLDGHIQDFCFWRWSEIQHDRTTQWSFLQSHNSIGLVVYNKNLKKIFKISTNQNTLWALAAMLDFLWAPKTKICYVVSENQRLSRACIVHLVIKRTLGGPVLNLWIVCRSEIQDGRYDST